MENINEINKNNKKDISIYYLFSIFVLYTLLNEFLINQGFFYSIGFTMGVFFMVIPFIFIIILIQKIRKLKYYRPILHTSIISVILFSLAIMGNLKNF